MNTHVPRLHTLAAMPPRDADMLLRSSERLLRSQGTLKAHHGLRRVTVYRRVLGLPPLMVMAWEVFEESTNAQFLAA